MLASLARTIKFYRNVEGFGWRGCQEKLLTIKSHRLTLNTSFQTQLHKGISVILNRLIILISALDRQTENIAGLNDSRLNGALTNY